MVGWILKNGFLNSPEIDTLVMDLYNISKARSMNLTVVKNTDIVFYCDNYGKPQLKLLKEGIKFPDYVIFWDKDFILAKHLEYMGVRVFNSSDSIRLCDDKILMMQNFLKLGVRVPKTIIGQFSFNNQVDSKFIANAFLYLGDEIVLKSAHGSFGMQVSKFTDSDNLINEIKTLNDRYILQEYIDSSEGTDLRVNIIGDEIIGGMIRSNNSDFRSNIKLGGTGFSYSLTASQKELALKAHKALGLDFSGVDILFGKGDEPILCEVNSNVNYLGFKKALGIEFGELLLEYIKRVL